MCLDSTLFLHYTVEQSSLFVLGKGGTIVWYTKISYKRKTLIAFEQTSKRRRGYPSESAVKQGMRIVHGNKDLQEKLGKEDLCPCGSGYRFQTVLPPEWQI